MTLGDLESTGGSSGGTHKRRASSTTGTNSTTPEGSLSTAEVGGSSSDLLDAVGLDNKSDDGLFDSSSRSSHPMYSVNSLPSGLPRSNSNNSNHKLNYSDSGK